MDYTKWDITYKEIAKDLGLNIKQDLQAATILEKRLQTYPLTKVLSVLQPFLYQKNVVIFGAGPSLEKNILKHRPFIEKANTIAADGATSALLKYHIKPDIITTDLDGYLPDQITANKNGSILIVHAHGDNIKKINKHFTSFKGVLIGSTQINPAHFPLLFNVGGFTDGDRAVYLADHYQANTISLIGFDFNGSIGEYSYAKKKDQLRKKQKLKWCQHLLEKLQNQSIIFL